MRALDVLLPWRWRRVSLVRASQFSRLWRSQMFGHLCPENQLDHGHLQLFEKPSRFEEILAIRAVILASS